MTARLGRQVAIVAASAIVVAIAAFFVLILTIRSLERATDEARAHERVATRAERIGALVVDAETGVRGFIISGRESFLEPLDRAIREMPARSGQLLSDARSEQERRLADRLTTEASSYLIDYALPTVDAARRSQRVAAGITTSNAGKRRVDAIRGQVAMLAQVADEAAQQRQRAASARGDVALASTIVAELLIVLLMVALVRGLRRRVVVPVREATDAARRIGSGDLSTRLATGRADEIGDLAAALNAMAHHLQHSADELEAQHAELESQNAELEQQSVELEAQALELERRGTSLQASHHALEARSVELERAGAELRVSRDRVRRYAEIAEALARVPDVEQRAARLLEALADAVDAPIGAIYARTAESDGNVPLLASRGFEAPSTLAEAGQLALRAADLGTTVLASHPEGSLVLETMGARVSVRHEVHLPLRVTQAEPLTLGVLTLGRTDARPFAADDLELLEHLTTTSSLALYNALVSAQHGRQAALLRSVLESVSESILVIDDEDRIVLSNGPMDRFARRLIGCEPGADWTIAALREAMEREVGDSHEHAAVTRSLANDPAAVERQTFEVPRLGAWFHRYIAPIHGPGGRLLGRIGVVRDITEERQAERAKDDLMATVSHELRTPLAAILGFAELLVMRDFPEDERREYLETVHQQSLRLSALLDDFLDLQRLERRGLGELATVDIADLVSEQVQLYSAQSERHHLVAATNGGPLTVPGDPERLRRVFGNLLSNAIKYSPDGGPVRVEALRDGDHVRVDVVDRGVGIPEEQSERIFDRFVRVDSGPAARIGGTGLGLSLVRDIVVAHGGEVGVESVEGEGSRFWITLPAEPGDRAQPAAPRS